MSDDDSPKYIIIAEKLKPHIDLDFQTGKRDVEEFKALIKRLKDNVLTAAEYKYAQSNFRLILLSLGLFHYVPEIVQSIDNIEFIFQQVTRLISDRYITSGKYTDKKIVVERLTTIMQETILGKEKFLTRKGDLKALYADLKDELAILAKSSTNSAEILKTKVPALLLRFREACIQEGVHPMVVHKILSLGREAEVGRYRYFEDFIELLDKEIGPRFV